MGKNRYSIEDVHKKTGLARSTISTLYHDRAKRIDFDTLTSLCSLFKCDVQAIIELDER